VRVPAASVSALHRARAEYADPARNALPSVVGESELSHTWPQERPDGFGYPFTLSWSGFIRLDPQVDPKLVLVPMPAATGIELWSPGPVHLEVEGIGAIDGYGNVGLNVPSDIVAGLYRFRATSLVVGDGVTQLKWRVASGAESLVPADALVLDAPVTTGFVARHYQGTDWTGPVLIRSIDPFAGPAPRLRPNYSVAMDGQLDVIRPGDYGFAVYAEWPVSVAIDGRTIVEYRADMHGWSRLEGTTSLAAGRHTLTLKYASVGRTSFRVEWQPPGEVWRTFTGQEVTHPLVVSPR
jgi:hypothetical protein